MCWGNCMEFVTTRGNITYLQQTLVNPPMEETLLPILRGILVVSTKILQYFCSFETFVLLNILIFEVQGLDFIIFEIF